MSLPRFQFSGSWTNPADFPTHEYSEAQVRADLMRLFSEIETYLNRTLLPLLESDSGGSGSGSGDASGNWLPKSGGQMTGPLLLYDDPDYATEAATKHYVDSTSSLIQEGLDGQISAILVELGRIRTIVSDGLGNVTEITIEPGRIETILQDDLGRLLELLLSAEQMMLHFQDGLQQSGIDMSAEEFRLWFEGVAGRIAELLMNDSEIRARVADEAAGLETSVSITADGLTSVVSDLFNDIRSILEQRPDLISAAVENAATGESSSLTLTPEQIAAAVENAVSQAGLTISADEISQAVLDRISGDFSQATLTADQIRNIVHSALSESELALTAQELSAIVQNLETGQSSQLSLTAEQIDFITRGVNGEFSSLTLTEDSIRQMVGDGLTRQAVLDMMADEITLQVQREVQSAVFSVTPESIRSMIVNALTNNTTVQEILDGRIRSQVISEMGSTSVDQSDTDLRAVVLGPDGDASSVALTQNGLYGTVQSHTGQIAALNTTAEEIRASVNGVNGRVSALSIRADGLDATVEAQGQNISSIQQRAGSIEQSVRDVNADMETMQGQYTSIRQEVDNISLSAVRDGRFARITLQVGDNTQVGDILMEGNVDVSGELSAAALYAARGEIAQLAVDEVSTSRRVTKYLNRDTSDDNYTRVCTLSDGTPVVQLVTGHYDNGTEQARTPDGHLLYWDGDIEGYTVGADGYPVVNGSRVYTTTTPGSPPVPVTVYRYREEVKLSLNFQDVNGVYTPVANFGAGNTQGWNKGYIVKGTEGFDLKYISNNNGREVGIRMTTDGFVDITGLRRVSGLNFSGWESGSFSVAMEGRSAPLGYSVSFDAQNRPVSITDASGFRTAIQW